MRSYFSTVREMCEAPMMMLWWYANIEEDKQEEAAEAFRTWLKSTPNRLDTVRCGDWNHARGFIRNCYHVHGLDLSPEKRIELYNFFNKPTVIVEHFAYLSGTSKYRETDCLDTSKYNVFRPSEVLL